MWCVRVRMRAQFCVRRKSKRMAWLACPFHQKTYSAYKHRVSFPFARHLLSASNIDIDIYRPHRPQPTSTFSERTNIIPTTQGRPPLPPFSHQPRIWTQNCASICAAFAHADKFLLQIVRFAEQTYYIHAATHTKHPHRIAAVVDTRILQYSCPSCTSTMGMRLVWGTTTTTIYGGGLFVGICANDSAFSMHLQPKLFISYTI